jgi:hypothetical protein
MKLVSPIMICLFALAVAVIGCASTTVTGQRQYVTGAVPRPNQIWVYDFIATASDIPADSSLPDQFSPSSAEPTAQQISAGRQLRALIARDLVADIQSIGLPAAQAGPGPRRRLVKRVAEISLRDAPRRLTTKSLGS